MKNAFSLLYIQQLENYFPQRMGWTQSRCFSWGDNEYCQRFYFRGLNISRFSWSACSGNISRAHYFSIEGDVVCIRYRGVIYLWDVSFRNLNRVAKFEKIRCSRNFSHLQRTFFPLERRSARLDPTTLLCEKRQHSGLHCFQQNTLVSPHIKNRLN